MPLFEVETESHIIITWAQDQDAAGDVVQDAYPHEKIVRLTKRPREHLGDFQGRGAGIAGKKIDPCHTARDCLSIRPPATSRTPSASTCTKPAATWERARRRGDRIQYGHGLVARPATLPRADAKAHGLQT